MELTRIEIFRAMNNQGVTNVKEAEGQILKPVAYHSHEYEDSDGRSHNVLVFKDGKSGNLYKSETQNFIKKFLAYDEAFGSLSDDEKPEIIITLKESKKGNRYSNFDVVD